MSGLPLMPKGHEDVGPRPERDADWYWTRATYALFAAVALIMLWTVADYGITWDEGVQATYGELALDYFASGGQDRSCNDYLNLSHHPKVIDGFSNQIPVEVEMNVEID